jgi:hypothetical protein
MVEKTLLNVALGRRSVFFRFLFFSFFFLLCFTTCTRETQRRFTGSDGWNCPSSFLIISRLRLSAKLNLSSIQSKMSRVAGIYIYRERERDTRAKYMYRRSQRGIEGGVLVFNGLVLRT